MERHIAIYVRVSTRKQDTRSQEPDLKRWAEAFADGQVVKWYRDKASGRMMDKSGWNRLQADIEAGKVSRVVVWRLDRLGRTAAGLTALFEDLRHRRIGLVSIKDSLDMETAAGRLMANVLASVAAYENEVRSERILAGQQAARAEGKVWGGSEKGRRLKVTGEAVEVVRRMRAEGETVAAIARAVSLSRPTVYRLLESKAARRLRDTQAAD